MMTVLRHQSELTLTLVARGRRADVQYVGVQKLTNGGPTSKMAKSTDVIRATFVRTSVDLVALASIGISFMSD